MAEVDPVRFFKNADFAGWKMNFTVADTRESAGAYPDPDALGWVTRAQVFFVSKGQFEYATGSEVYSLTDQTPFRKWGTSGAYRLTCVSDTGEIVCLTPTQGITQWQAERVVLAGNESHTVDGDITRQYIYVIGTATVNGVSVTDDVVAIAEAEDAVVVAGAEGGQIMHIHTPKPFNRESSSTKPAEISEPIR